MMRAWIDTLFAFSTTLRNVGRRRVTEPLPWKRLRAHPERYRAGFALTDDEHGEVACIACKACENVCPSGIIRVEGERRESPVTGKKRAYPVSFVLDMNACIFCELCVQVCPSDAIRMRTAWTIPGTSREDQVLTLERLRANAREGHLSWATPGRLRAMQDPERKNGEGGEP
ncbi:MAG: 4Fe-4S binding protein [Deltaproteobacteria bacterium]|nr:4Fe-4S binding protein [Deltaproteobacteria bacterium]